MSEQLNEDGICAAKDCDHIVNYKDGETICVECKCAYIEIEKG